VTDSFANPPFDRRRLKAKLTVNSGDYGDWVGGALLENHLLRAGILSGERPSLATEERAE
jgi:hypothetical protein